jgi:hypothetical protein
MFTSGIQAPLVEAQLRSTQDPCGGFYGVEKKQLLNWREIFVSCFGEIDVSVKLKNRDV